MLPAFYAGRMSTPSRPRRRVRELPGRKPMAPARRVSLFEREIRVRLSSAALDIMFDLAAVLSEGQWDGERYYGSTMVTIDLARATRQVSDACDVATARRVAELIATDERVRERARDLGAREAARLAGRPIDRPQVDLRLRRTGCHLHLDMDIEASPEKTA